MASVGDLVANLSIDVSQFTAPLDKAIAQYKSFANTAEESHKRIEQSSSKGGGGGQAQAATATQKVSDSFKTLATVALTAIRVASLFYPKVNVLGQSLGSLGWKAYAAQKIVNQMPDAHSRAAQAAEQQAAAAKKLEHSQSGLANVGHIVGVASVSALASAIAYKSGLDEVIEASGKYLSLGSPLMKSVAGITDSLRRCVMTGIDMFSEGIKGSLVAVLSATTGFGSLTEVVDYIGKGVTSGAATVEKGFKSIADGARDAGLIFGTAIAIFQSGGTIDAAAFYEEGAALNKLAEDSARVIEGQQSLASAIGLVKEAQLAVTSAAGQQAKMAAVSRMETTGEIDAYLTSMKEEFRTMDQASLASKTFRKNTTELTQALEKRRIAIETKAQEEPKQIEGSKDAQHAYESAVAGLNKLKYGQEEAARLAIMASNATDEEVIALLALHDETVALAAAQEQQKKADDLFKNGADRIENMKDQLDLLTGAATNAEVEMRKMSRAGFSEEQIAEVGRLQDAIDAAKAKDEKPGKEDKAGKSESKASLIGSSETASLFLRGVGGQSNDIPNKQLKEQQEINAGMQSLVAAFQATKPANAQVVSI